MLLKNNLVMNLILFAMQGRYSGALKYEFNSICDHSCNFKESPFESCFLSVMNGNAINMLLGEKKYFTKHIPYFHDHSVYLTHKQDVLHYWMQAWSNVC